MNFKETKQISLEQLRALVSAKQLHVWGAGNQGRGIARVLQENGIAVKAFVDSSEEIIGRSIAGLPVLSPKSVFEMPLESVFVIIAAFFYEQEISKICCEHGLREGNDFISYSSLKPRDYAVDVSGSCNLRCISCPRATGKKASNAAVMSFDDFSKVIDKIKKEDPFVGNIQLYQWGEPTLNKELPRMIRYALERGIYSAVSSNLNLKADYRKIIEARPEWFRVSASGWGAQYEITHTGGSWEVFFHNLKEVARLRREIHQEMKLELYYHLYKHSTGEDFVKMQELCKQLHVEFHPVYAYLISLDDVLQYQEGVELPETAKQAGRDMLLSLEEGLARARNESRLGCDTFRSIHINADLSVSNCMMYYYPEGNRAVNNFLNSSISEIMSIRKSCKLCKRCMKYAMHRYCSAYATFQPDSEKLAIHA